MAANNPKYKIGYLYCKQKDHQTQKTNLVCLNKDCVTNSLICSFCRQQKHKGHVIKPLKHFLENLEKQHRENKDEGEVDKDLDQLQNQKNMLLGNLSKAVQNLAEKFMQLEEQIIQKYEIIRSQILQRQSQKNRFSDFYKIMAHQSRGDPTFQIQNYLNFQPLYSFKITNDLQKFITDSDAIFHTIKTNLISKNKDHLQTKQLNPTNQLQSNNFNKMLNNQKYKLAKTIKCNGNILSQTKITTKQTIGYLNQYLKDIEGKIRIKVINLPKESTLTIGVSKEANILESNFQFPIKNKIGAFWVTSKGEMHGCNYNYIKSIQTGAFIDILVKKNHCKLSIKSNICDIILPDKQSSVLFFSLEGICQIQIIYPYTKY